MNYIELFLLPRSKFIVILFVYLICWIFKVRYLQKNYSQYFHEYHLKKYWYSRCIKCNSQVFLSNNKHK